MIVKKKKILIPVAIGLVAVIGVAAFASRAASADPQTKTVDTYVAARGELMNTVDVTGMVESSDTVRVYTTLSCPVQSIAVKVGDVVKEGDLLCTLDATDLQTTIRQNEAMLASMQAKASNELKLAQKEYATAQEDVKKDYNSQLLQAEQAVKDREAAVKSAQNGLERAEYDYRNAREDLRDLQDDDYEYDDDISYDAAVEAAKRTRAGYEITLENAQQNLEKAKEDLEAAKSSLRAAQKQVNDSVEAAKDRVTTAQLNTNVNDQVIALEKLRADLAEANVSAPVSGTVTAIFAKVGANSGANGGLLLVIEDTNSLKVKTKIKEYDIGLVNVGMPVIIRADGTGDEEFDGELTLVSPTSLKDESGNTVNTTSSEFAAEVAVKGKSQLRIGMNARLKIITEQKQDTLYVPVEAVTVDEEGTDVVFVLDTSDTGVSTARKVPVKTGMENDFFCEILGDSIQEGEEIILDPSGLVDGMQVAKMQMDPMTQAAAQA